MPIITYVRAKDENIDMECWDTRYRWKVIEVGEINEDGTQPAQIDIKIYTEDDDGKKTDLVEVAIWLFEQTYRYKYLPGLYKVIFEEMKKLMPPEELARYEQRERDWVEWWERYKRNYR